MNQPVEPADRRTVQKVMELYDYLDEQGAKSVRDLARRSRTSPDTIRKYLAAGYIKENEEGWIVPGNRPRGNDGIVRSGRVGRNLDLSETNEILEDILNAILAQSNVIEKAPVEKSKPAAAKDPFAGILKMIADNADNGAAAFWKAFAQDVKEHTYVDLEKIENSWYGILFMLHLRYKWSKKINEAEKIIREFVDGEIEKARKIRERKEQREKENQARVD